jgi:hypothetical protein
MQPDFFDGVQLRALDSSQLHLQSGRGQYGGCVAERLQHQAARPTAEWLQVVAQAATPSDLASATQTLKSRPPFSQL